MFSMYTCMLQAFALQRKPLVWSMLFLDNSPLSKIHSPYKSTLAYTLASQCGLCFLITKHQHVSKEILPTSLSVPILNIPERSYLSCAPNSVHWNLSLLWIYKTLFTVIPQKTNYSTIELELRRYFRDYLFWIIYIYISNLRYREVDWLVQGYPASNDDN